MTTSGYNTCPECGGRKTWRAKRCQKCQKKRPTVHLRKTAEDPNAFTVVHDPTGTFDRMNRFTLGAFNDGLRCGWCWPVGMQVMQRNLLYTVCEDPGGETYADEFGDEWPVQVLRRVRNG